MGLYIFERRTNMKKEIAELAKKGATECKKSAPALMIFAGTILFGITIASSIKETRRAVEEEKEFTEETTTKDKVMTYGKIYAPTIAFGTASLVCVCAGNWMYVKRLGAIAAAYKITESAYKDYKDEVLEFIGEKKEKEVKDRVAQKRVNESTPNEIADVKPGKTLCYDTVFGRYFESDIESIRQAVNQLNYELGHGAYNYISVNDFWEAIGLEPADMGDRLGWHSDFGLIEVTYSSTLTLDGVPCLAISYEVTPGYEFDKM